MARILYGLCSVGIGHAVRSKTILDHLRKKHKILIVTSERAYTYLKPNYTRVYNTGGLELAFRGNKVLTARTVLQNLFKFNKRNYARWKSTEKKSTAFKPDLVISDWETSSSMYAHKHHIPLISIDNGHYIRFGDYPFSYEHPFQQMKAHLVLYALMRQAEAYIILLLPGLHLHRRAPVYAAPPIVRDAIIKAQPKKKNYILVYQSTNTYTHLLPILRTIPKQFIVYGFDHVGKEGNITFKKFDKGNTFTMDLANAQAVITNGGFTLISEALYLHKPLLVVPIKKHFEQYLNAKYVQDHHFGVMHEHLTKEHVSTFIAHLDHYRFDHLHWDNNQLFTTLDHLIQRFTS